MTRQILQHHPKIGYTFVPNIRARVPHEGGGYLVRGNAQGFRCEHDFEAIKTGPRRRVLLFGDSFTAGDGVSNAERYGDRLEALVPDIEVYNFGLPGTGTDQHYLVYKEYASKIDCDLVVISVLVENIRRIAARYRPYGTQDGKTVLYAKPYFTLDGNQLALQNVPVGSAPLDEAALPEEDLAYIDRGGRFETVRKLVRRTGLKKIAQQASRYQPVPEYNDPAHPSWQIMKAILTAWLAELKQPVVLVPLPLYQHVEGKSGASGYQARFSEFCAGTGCILHDPLADLQRRSKAERRAMRFKRDIHPTPLGHAALAESLAPIVSNALHNLH